jgi:hypothetical protein
MKAQERFKFFIHIGIIRMASSITNTLSASPTVATPGGGRQNREKSLVNRPGSHLRQEGLHVSPRLSCEVGCK